ncbi:MAG: 5-methyltetrahydropteroyltriglutamate--homocysteine S-methyltransferase [Clostridium beijerinckii]|jgi:methionine synthase II (cobalamin-independent)|uniref:5-methyltetrahydropteroyltriglutamate-- homocysteine S-methyltransferase n=1 Tax=Clostridium beijerinckii TaxID=1520 RepID=UPI00149402B2|nr:5-methyltetrahydropteroyltriglutamate--homocysteine S-methyltransferase [Clostridium beijerinckii]MCI1580578.1 5-methyltetrahydropteroyltriglutamate--homocysteine S-methyltransferase [Clostridium beijerinckii]MCI1583765.1 5-methyltetrahydropteroyltriglutamate--homocysteine S-methyltransferase [Clostridium beijerinckii]MCI1623829.1 5-methyltetrahydropteroyltriglutamate--homocysteine S-methyltransferase [Clostridium beijerinckii]NOW83931.1 methionine synthase II (cobalamin-independent) [Clostr
MSIEFKNAKQRSVAPFRADIVGSFLRPDVIKEARAKFQNQEISSNELKRIEDEEIIKLVKKQKELGLKAVTDGEFRRSWWHLDFMWGLDGVEKRVLETGYKFNGLETRAETATLTGKIDFSNHPMVEHYKFLKSISGDDVIARQTIPAPAQFLAELQRGENKDITESIYKNIDELILDIANAYKKAIKAFYNEGCRNLQLDDCTWGMLCDKKYWEARQQEGVDTNDIAKLYAKVNNLAIEDHPEDLVITMHVCRGNYNSTWAGSGGYEPVAEILFGTVNVDGFYLEYDTDRAGDFAPLRFIKNQQVVLGLISSKTGILENKEEVRERIREATKYVDINQVCLSPQCGFASTEEGNVLTEEEQWNKIKLVREISEEIWK